jgi:hypothetical protein
VAEGFGLNATRCYYRPSPNPPYFSENLATFQFVAGRDSWTHSTNSRSLVASILKLEPDTRVLEVSTASDTALGVKLSALNLVSDTNWGTHSVEKVFQASKIFERGGPYLEVLDLPGNPKSHAKLTNSGKLIGFAGPDGLEFRADGTSAFYDRLYVSALIQNSELLLEAQNFDVFTDLRFAKRIKGFSPTQPINTQARSCAIAKSLFMKAGLTELENYVSRIEGGPPPINSSVYLFEECE